MGSVREEMLLMLSLLGVPESLYTAPGRELGEFAGLSPSLNLQSPARGSHDTGLISGCNKARPGTISVSPPVTSDKGRKAFVVSRESSGVIEA